MSVILMYHALHPDGDTGLIESEDLPYAISESDFLRQMDALSVMRCGTLQSEAGATSQVLPDVIITFDDGHVSNHQLAMPHLRERGLGAHVFVTTGFIGQRRGFCVPEQVAEMSDNGLLVGAHGVSHRFLDDLSSAEVVEELRSSREKLQLWTGREVTSLSFPGGRFSAKVLELARDEGYVQLFGSEFGMVSDDSPAAYRHRTLERVPVRRSTTLEEFRLITEGNKAWFERERRRHSLKAGARRLLGNKLYHGLYKSFS